MAARRRALGWSQGELAERGGLSRQFVNLLESGKTQPNVQVALQLARLLESTVEELFGGGGSAGVMHLEPAEFVTGLVNAKAGSRVVLGQVDGRWVAHAADTTASLGGGFAPAINARVKLTH
jgi:DNA-binding XRE family transcriptional regulator